MKTYKSALRQVTVRPNIGEDAILGSVSFVCDICLYADVGLLRIRQATHQGGYKYE